MRLKYLLLPVVLALVIGGMTYLWNPATLFQGGQAATIEPGPAGPENRANTSTDRRMGARENVGREVKPIERRRPLNPDAVPVVVAPVRQTDFPIYLAGLGTVIAYNTIDVKAQVDGVIERLNFQEGDDVKVGDPLVNIDRRPYEARLEQWQAAKARALAQLENAKTNLWRDQQLLAQDFATQRQTDATKALVGQYTADVAEYDAQIKFAQTQLDFTIIRSPINGRTGIRRVDPGNFIRAADNVNIVTIVQLQPISVIITLPAKQLAQAGISQGLNDMPVIAYAENGRTQLDRGKVQAVDNSVDPATGTIKLKANFPNVRHKLWPGDFVDCRIMVDKRRNGLTVPTAAIRHGPKGDFVWVIKPDGTAEHRPVAVKQTRGDTVLLDKGVQADEKVVVEGQYRLRSGSHVEIVSRESGDEPEVSSTE